MKAQWKDKKGTWYGKKGIVESTIKLGQFNLIIHHYIGSGNNWYTSCGNLFTLHSLSVQNIDSLKEQALKKLKFVLLEAIEDFPI